MDAGPILYMNLLCRLMLNILVLCVLRSPSGRPRKRTRGCEQGAESSSSSSSEEEPADDHRGPKGSVAESEVAERLALAIY